MSEEHEYKITRMCIRDFTLCIYISKTNFLKKCIWILQHWRYNVEEKGKRGRLIFSAKGKAKRE